MASYDCQFGDSKVLYLRILILWVLPYETLLSKILFLDRFQEDWFSQALGCKLHLVIQRGFPRWPNGSLGRFPRHNLVVEIIGNNLFNKPTSIDSKIQGDF